MATPQPISELVHVGQVISAQDFMPLFDIGQAVARQQAMSEFIGKILKEGIDFGVIPGTNKGKVLLKPGAEKLCTFFGLTPMFTAEHVIEDWSGEEHGGEPLFYYRYKCQLWRGDRLLAEAVGSCNSREKKYRYRGGERKCPQCGKATIIKGKAEYGGGFLCFAKKGGCGAKFGDADPAITGQEVGQVVNPDIADTVNTVQKIAQKRALVAVVLIGTNVSDSFTQDLEEDADHMQGNQAAADAVAEKKLANGKKDAPPEETIPEKNEDPELAELYKKATGSVSEFDDICSDLCAPIDKAFGSEAMHKAYQDAVEVFKKQNKAHGVMTARRAAIAHLWNCKNTAEKEMAAVKEPTNAETTK